MSRKRRPRAIQQADESAAVRPEEIATLAGDLARAYRQMAAWYHHELELSGPEADARARGTDYTEEEAAADLERFTDAPPDQVSWFDLERVVERDPDQVVAIWKRIKAAARDELSSGYRIAGALEWEGGPWTRAQFIAIRESLAADGAPRSGVEAALLDLAAEAFSDYLSWSEHLHMQQSTEVLSERQQLEQDGGWSPPRLMVAEAMERSARMAEAAHQRFLRTVKMLTDLRRLASSVYVGHAGQINVGQQQVNLAASTRDGRSRSEDLPKSTEDGDQ